MMLIVIRGADFVQVRKSLRMFGCDTQAIEVSRSSGRLLIEPHSLTYCETMCTSGARRRLFDGSATAMALRPFSGAAGYAVGAVVSRPE